MSLGGNAQSTVLQEGQQIAYPGARWGEEYNARSTFNAEGSAGMLPGIFVATDPSDGTGRSALLLTAATDPIHGLVMRDYSHAPGTWGFLDTDGSYKAGAAFACMTEGLAFAIAETSTCAPGDKVYVRCIANGGNTTIGAVTDTSDNANTVLLTNAVFRGENATLSDGTKIALINFRLPV